MKPLPEGWVDSKTHGMRFALPPLGNVRVTKTLDEPSEIDVVSGSIRASGVQPLINRLLEAAAIARDWDAEGGA